MGNENPNTQTTAVAAKKDYANAVLAIVKEQMDNGLVLPKDYNAVNAIKCSMIALEDLRDRNGRHFTEVCTASSIKTALFKMVTKGLDVSKSQGYMCIRGDKLCFEDEYFGKICQIRRLYPDWQPITHVVYKGDVFEYGISPETGYTKLIKHEQKLSNRDPNNWVGGYVYFPTADGKRDLYVMSRYEIEAAWSQSGNKALAVHKKFIEKMVGKTLINTGANRILNPTDSTAIGGDGEGQDAPNDVKDVEYVDVDAEVAMANEQEQPQPQPQEPEPASDPTEPTDEEKNLFNV